MDDLLKELQNKLEANAKATIDSYFEPLKDRKRQELEDLELQHQQALENWSVSWRNGGNDSSRISRAPQESPDFPEEKFATRSGPSEAPTKRAMLTSVLPDFKEATFLRRDVDEKIIKRWPEVEPKTKAESKAFKASIASLLADLVAKGKLKATKGENRFDPTVYQVVENDENTLLRSGP
jgi:hypothetical protein